MGDSMRKIWIMAAALLLLLTAAGCSQGSKNETAAPTEAPTDAPYIDTQISQPEWTLTEGDLQLEDNDNIYAMGDDILYFAIVTTADGAQELRFRLDNVTANMLTKQNPDNNYYITLDGVKIGNATLNENCTVATITAENANGEITALATKIRGLAE